MPFATRLTKVRDRSEHFDERTGMCYHQAPPLERVVMHGGDAGQAKPHLEHNPLSLLGACYATPGRKLNDPVYITTSLDGYIARPSGAVDWAFTDQDYGYTEFFTSIDTVLMGRKTYEQVLSFGPYPYTGV